MLCETLLLSFNYISSRKSFASHHQHVKGKRTGDEIIDACKTMRGSSEFGLFQSVCGQSVKDLICLFANIVMPSQANNLFLNNTEEKKVKDSDLITWIMR